MLPPEPSVLDGRQAFLDAQAAFAGPTTSLGFFSVSWYGSAVSDERGCFGVVDPAMGLADAVGEIVAVSYRDRIVYVYVIGSQDGLGTDLGDHPAQLHGAGAAGDRADHRDGGSVVVSGRTALRDALDSHAERAVERNQNAVPGQRL